MCWTCTNPRKPTSCAACCISSCCAYLFTPTMTCRAEGGRRLGGEGGMSIARIIHIHERPLPAGPAGPAKLAMLKLCVLAAPAYCCQPSSCCPAVNTPHPAHLLATVDVCLLPRRTLLNLQLGEACRVAGQLSAHKPHETAAGSMAHNSTFAQQVPALPDLPHSQQYTHITDQLTNCPRAPPLACANCTRKPA